ncbi:RNA-guided endonuclease InsQ/TnpB family protein [Methanolobus halotolerans]|uniref:Transposase n=1 Tax=Methanolobus halotolerans TaxID=2052935 RepID=A0A4E0PTS9_9EURY|nr:RNA-guided endonuclease TnpB family protein [Methanolobus halotolerans]TGC08019.1 transposase [Methanolobus halotolerans]
MILTKTVILKIENPDNNLVETMQRYSEGMNHASSVVFHYGKTIGSYKLQQIVYGYLRETIGLKSQMSCNIPRQVAGCYKTLKEQIKEGKVNWKEITFSPYSMTLSYKRDFSISQDSVAITTINNGRKSYKIQNYDNAQQYFDGTWKFTASKVLRHKDGNHYFHLSIEKDVPEKELEETSNYMGVDLGMNYLAVASTTEKKCNFFAGGHIKDIRNQYKSMRTRLQSKGTLSAKRMIKHLSDKEKRLMRDVNHVVSKQIIKFAIENNVSIIGLEDLKGIRENRVRKTRRNNRYHHSSWAYRQLQDFIEYKAIEAGIKIQFVDPAHTSQECNQCNHVAKNNRNRLNFACKKCGYENNADLNAAMNIEKRTRDIGYTSLSQGCLSATQTNA